MDTETKKAARAGVLLAKVFSQTAVSVLAILALLVAAILNPELWIQFAIALGAVGLTTLFVYRVKKVALEQLENADNEPSSKELLANKLAKRLPIFALVIAVAAVLISDLNKLDLSAALTVFAAALLLTNNQSVALSIPLGLARVFGFASDESITIRSRRAFEKLGKLNLLLFTKGGVLTNSPTGVNAVRLASNSSFQDESVLLALAASVESMSNHAYAIAITKSASNSGLKILKPKNFKEVPGYGVEGIVSGKLVVVGSTALLIQRNIRMEVQELLYADESAGNGYSIVCVVVDGVLEGILRFSDVVKESAATAVYLVAKERIRVGLITGDSAGTAQHKADQVSISEVYAELSPERKAYFVMNEQTKGTIVGVVANPDSDSKLLRQADVSISFGDEVSATAHVSVLGEDPLKASRVLALSAQFRKKTNQGQLFGLGYSICSLVAFVAIVSPLPVVAAPAVAALLGSLSVVVVTLNAYSIGKLK